jgi:hypothetical protein
MLALTSLTSGGRLVNIVRSRTQDTEFSLFAIDYFYSSILFESFFPYRRLLVVRALFLSLSLSLSLAGSTVPISVLFSSSICSQNSLCYSFRLQLLILRASGYFSVLPDQLSLINLDLIILPACQRQIFWLVHHRDLYTTYSAVS